MSRQNPHPTLKEVIELKMLQAMARFNCVSIGTIQSFDVSNQTANISINYQRIIKNALPAGNTGETADKIVPYPILVQCPVIFLNGGGASLTFPIRPGDTCIVLFCDREIDTWFKTGTSNNPPNNERLHDLSDAVALVGIRSMQNKMAGYDANSVKMLNAGSFIKIDMSGNIEIHGGNITVDGAVIQVQGSGAVTIQGSTVSINP